MDNIFYRVLLRDEVKVEPRYLGNNFRHYVQQKLRAQNEGVCTKHGYIRENSIEIYKVAPGVVDKIGLNGYVVFEVHYYAEVCNPLLGNVVKAKVVNVNKFGILAEVAPILEIIVAKNSVNILSDSSIDLESIRPGDWIHVEIMGKKFELNDKKISIVGRVVTQGGKPATSPKQKPQPKEDEEEDVDKFDLEDDTEDSEKDEEEDDSDEEEEEDAAEEEEEEDLKGGADEFFNDTEEEDEDEEEFDLFSEAGYGEDEDDGSDASESEED